MKTIKIIDLLIMVANNEELPKRIMFLGNTYRYDEIDKTYRNTVGNTNIGEMHNLEFYLNDEVEIIEEDKEIEILIAVNGSDLVDLQKNSTLEEQNKSVTNLIMYLNANVEKTNELVRAVNELRGEH